MDASLTFLLLCFYCIIIENFACLLEEHGFCLLVQNYRKTYKHYNSYGVKIAMDIL
jgi:hypothetical protein